MTLRATAAERGLWAPVLMTVCWPGCRRLDFGARDVFLQRTPISFDVSGPPAAAGFVASPGPCHHLGKAAKTECMHAGRRPCKSSLAR